MVLQDVFVMITKEHQRSVELHGTWWDYTPDQMMSVIINELMMEAGAAEARGDIHGEHGMIRELIQVAVCCIKAVMVLMIRPKGHLAGASRTVGAHSCSTGCALLASPSHHQDKEIMSNRPEGGAAC